MSAFYTSIIDHYEDIFPFNPLQLKWMKALAGDDKDILDLACGTGILADGLAKEGYNVTAVDLDPEMARMAKEKGTFKAHQMSMLDLHTIEGEFDLIYCIGNSLPHLDSEAEIKLFVERIKSKLRDNGRLTLQMINFAPFWSEKSDALGNLPTIKNEVIEFERKYIREAEKIRFHTKLHAGGKVLENDQMLYPILAPDMVRILEEVGFKNVQTYGGFNKAEFDINTSIPFILTANA